MISDCFTTSSTLSAPVVWSKNILEKQSKNSEKNEGSEQYAFLINAGCANVFTGKKGVIPFWN